MYCRRRLLELREKLIPAVRSFLERSQQHLNDPMVSYTHVQHAQPISVAYWLSHYSAILLRDLDRLKRAYDVTDENPLGTGAIAGTSFPIDRHLTTKLLGFQKIHEHGLDATSSRDFMLESCSSAATLYTTYSRLAEEFILWSSYEFRTLTLDDGFAMGSSMMPQKKNPGALELLRGRAGRVNGLLMAAFTLMKGLPSGYNRDFHEDKEILVEIMNLTTRATQVIAPLVKSTKINLDRMAELPWKNFCAATEVANFLVGKHNVPFRAAHHIVGTLVGELSRAGGDFSDIKRCHEYLLSRDIKCTIQEVQRVLEPASVMMSYNSLGGTGPKAVSEMLSRQEAELKKHEGVLGADKARVKNAYDASRAIAKESGNVKTVDDLAALISKYGPK